MLSPRYKVPVVCFAAILPVVASGCSIRKMAVNSLADALASSGDVYASDDDPELVGQALPFALKTFETLLAEAPENAGLLLATCKGFTQYSYAYVEIDLLRAEIEDYDRYKHQRDRALKLYLRARDYCLRSAEVEAPGIRGRLAMKPESAVADFGSDDVELMVWIGSSWGKAISLGLDRPDLVADLPVVRALVGRALELDPTYEKGLLHEAMVVVESLPEAMGGSVERARHHYERALELNGGTRPSTYVTWAELISYRRQDREEFERMLQKALEIDPEMNESERLATLITQKRARILLDIADDLFL